MFSSNSVTLPGQFKQGAAHLCPLLQLLRTCPVQATAHGLYRYKSRRFSLKSGQATRQPRFYHTVTSDPNIQQPKPSSTATMPPVKVILNPPQGLLDEVKASSRALADGPPPVVKKEVELPEGFLEGPGPNVTREPVNWFEGGLFDNQDKWAVVLDGVLTVEECKQIVAAAGETTNGKWERAMVNIGGGQQALLEDTRNCGRIIWDNRNIVEKIWARVAPSVPEIQRLEDWVDVTGMGPVKRDEVWKATRLNERMRFLKYQGGEYFKPHCDGCYETPDRKERSYFTLHLYLNDADGKDGSQPLVGGATTFFTYDMQRRMDVVPKAGRVLLFQHRGLLHSGDDVISGTKYTMRTDIMYAKE